MPELPMFLACIAFPHFRRLQHLLSSTISLRTNQLLQHPSCICIFFIHHVH